ncbi:MAG TPA: BON domain-containing protein [Chryseosolibacter sp.]
MDNNKSGNTRGYNRPAYYRHNERLGNERTRNQDEQSDTTDNEYDDLNTGKTENYKGGGYYGSNYGAVNELNRGRDYEQNAGYRDNYNNLTTGQWPEIEEAARRRGFDPNEIQRMKPGYHRGKGPRTYQRSDVRILDDVHDILLEDPYVDASEVEIDVQKGEVILTGWVEDRNMKRRVDDIVGNVSGITHFENRLRVRKQTQIVNISNSEK